MKSITPLKTDKVYHAGNLSQSIYFKGLGGLPAKKEGCFFQPQVQIIGPAGRTISHPEARCTEEGIGKRTNISG